MLIVRSSLSLSKVRYLKLSLSIITGQREEWYSKDLVVDSRETWKKWFNRQLNFEDPPLIPREELPEQF